MKKNKRHDDLSPVQYAALLFLVDPRNRRSPSVPASIVELAHFLGRRVDLSMYQIVVHLIRSGYLDANVMPTEKSKGFRGLTRRRAPLL